MSARDTSGNRIEVAGYRQGVVILGDQYSTHILSVEAAETLAAELAAAIREAGEAQ